MALIPGTRLGPYDIVALLGVGGMGEVYRTTDTNLKRQVAIKVLPTAVAADSDRLARFQREAEVLAALNHPNIAQIFGIEKADGTIALVMELVEGPTLADRIAQGAIPLADALPIAKQIAEALEAAHEAGIIHRDLKPANIKVREDGTVKVLDFGLAKAMESPASSDHAMNSPTISLHATQAGMILGTAAYMAPEQARGSVVDKRADLWAFGVVLYEMLTGTRLFDGATISDTLAAVLTKEPDWTTLPANTPAPVRKLLRRCLEKDRKRRLDSASAARLEIDDALTAPAADPSPAGAAASSSARGSRLWMLVAAVAVLAAAGLAVPAVRHLREVPPDAPPETRLEITTPAGGDPLSFALSPDGRQLVFVASGDGASRLWLRSLSTTTAQPMAGTDGAQYPFWAPDSRAVAFFADGQLKRLDLGGGAPRALATAPLGRGGSWNADGVLLFAPTAAGPLFRVAAAGGDAAPVTTLDRQGSHRFPVFLPDGRHFLFYAYGGPDTAGIHLGTLDAGAPTRLTAADTAGTYLPAGAGRDGGPGGAEALREGGWLLWTRAGTLQAQRLDLPRRALTGDPVTLADAVAYDGTFQRSAVAVSATGLVAYRAGRASRRQLTWVDRTGTVLGTLGAPDEHSLFSPRVAPDGRRVAVSRTVQGNTDLWLLDGARTSRVTFDAGSDRLPIWSPDGRRLVFDSDRTGVRDLYGKDASGAGVEARLVASAQQKFATDWSADGRFLLYDSLDPQTGGDLWAQEMDPSTGAARAGGAPGTVLRTPFTERGGRFSPDGRWVAYQSDASGRTEIYVRPWTPPAAGAAAPAPSAQWQVSTAGGTFPSWRADGQALYYLGPAGALMAAPVTTRGTALELGTPVALFPTRILGGGADGGSLLAPQYDVTRDGRFLINTVLDDAAATPITLIQHWRPE